MKMYTYSVCVVSAVFLLTDHTAREIVHHHSPPPPTTSLWWLTFPGLLMLCGPLIWLWLIFCQENSRHMYNSICKSTNNWMVWTKLLTWKSPKEWRQAYKKAFRNGYHMMNVDLIKIDKKTRWCQSNLKLMTEMFVYHPTLYKNWNNWQFL